MSVSDLCTHCGHPRHSHADQFSEEKRAAFTASFAVACVAQGCLEIDCQCTQWGEPQTLALETETPPTAPELPPAPDPGDARLVLADERQVRVIVTLARSVGLTVVMNWDQLPTGLTRGLSMTQMGCAALIRSTAQLLASGLVQLEDTDPRIVNALEVHVEMLRDSFAQFRKDARDPQPAAGDPETKAAPAPVMVPAPKWTM